MNTLPKITGKQKEIINLLYKFRFLNRIQIQTLLKHKDPKTINVWLKSLRENGYVEWIYSTDFAEKTKPAIYYLALNGIRYLKTRNEESIGEPSYPIVELRKRYRDSARSRTYIDRCLLLVDCCISLDAARDEDAFPESWYFYETEADYLGDSFYHFLTESELVHPDLCFDKVLYEGHGEPYTQQSYLLEVFDATLPRYRMKKRLSNYITYLDEYSLVWKESTYTDVLPTILLVCPRLSDLIYAKRRTRGLLANLWYGDVRPRIRFITIEHIKAQGILSKQWEEA